MVFFYSGWKGSTAARSGCHVSHTSEKAGDRVGSFRARSCSSRLVLCTFRMARQRCLSRVRNVERFTAQCTFCTSRVLIFLKPPLILFSMKPYVVKSAFSWHCVSLLHNSNTTQQHLRVAVTPRREDQVTDLVNVNYFNLTNIIN